MWQQFYTFWQTIPDLLTPKPVRIDRSLDERLSDAIAQAVHNPTFRTQLLDRPQQALANLDIQLPPTQIVFAVESTPQQTFLVIPMMTDREVEILQSGLNSGRALRAKRWRSLSKRESRIILKAWQDADYKAQLIADPKAVLVIEGF